MLGLRDRYRQDLKNVEFRYGRFVPPYLLARLGIGSPYLDEDHRYSCIFVHVPKSAGTSLRAAIYGRKSFHVPAIRYYRFDLAAFASYFKFSFVRNPWSRCYSAYEYLAKRIGADPAFPDHRWATAVLGDVSDFHAFVYRLEDPRFRRVVRSYIHFRDQLDWISLPVGFTGDRRLCMDFVGRYETLGDDYRRLCERLGLDVQLPRLRSSESRDYRQAYDTRMVDIVGHLYRADIEAFGYAFE